MTSLRSLYIEECKTLKLPKPNSQILARLPSDPDSDEFKELSISSFAIGSKGLRALLPVIKASPELTALNLSGNNLTNPPVSELLKILVAHGKVEWLDLSDNPLTAQIGPLIIQLVKRNRGMVQFNLERTLVRTLVLNCVKLQLDRNLTVATPLVTPEWAQRGTGHFLSSIILSPDKSGKEEAEAEENEETTNGGFMFGGGFCFGNGNGDHEDGEQEEEDDHRSPDIAVDEEEHTQHAAAYNSATGSYRRKTVSGRAFNEDRVNAFEIQTSSDTSELAMQFLIKVLSSHSLFQHLEDREMAPLLMAMKKKVFTGGDEIYREGDIDDEGGEFYVLRQGTCDTRVGGASVSLKPGSCFGDQSMLYIVARDHTVTVTSAEAEVYALSSNTYQNFVSGAFMKKRKLYYDFLSKVGFLANTTHTEKLQIADALEPYQCDAGKAIISYGEEGKWCHIVVEGKVEVIGRDKQNNHIKVCEFGVGDCVGELEFIYNHRTVADVIALTHLRTARLNRRHFEMFMGPIVDVLKRNASEANPTYNYYNATRSGQNVQIQEGHVVAIIEDFALGSFKHEEDSDDEHHAWVKVRRDYGSLDVDDSLNDETDEHMRRAFFTRRSSNRRMTVACEEEQPDEMDSPRYQVVPKTEKQAALLRLQLAKVALFKDLEPQEMDMVVNAMEECNFTKGQMLQTQGGDDNDQFMIIREGECEIAVDGEVQDTLKVGDTVAEAELLHSGSPRASVVVVSDTCSCWALKRSIYQRGITNTFMAKKKTYVEYLESISKFSVMTKAELIQLADCLSPSSYAAGDCILNYGEEGMWMHILLDGECRVVGRDDDMKLIEVGTFLDKGWCMGDLEFINGHSNVADVIAKTDVRTAKLHRYHFELCMGPIKDLLGSVTEEPKYQYYVQKTAHVPLKASDNEIGFTFSQGYSFGGFGFASGPSDDDGSDADGNDEDEEEDVDDNPSSMLMVKLQTRRTTVSNERMEFDEGLDDFNLTLTEKSPGVTGDLMNVLQQNSLFSHLEPHELSKIVPAMAAAAFRGGDVILEAGEHVDTPCFYIVMSGTALLSRPGSSSTSEIKFLQTFGELDLMYNQPSQVTITARTDVHAYSLDRDSYRKLLGGIFTRKRAQYSDLLGNISLLKLLSRKEMLQLADALAPQIYQPGQHLINYGEEGMWFYIILEGTVEVFGRDDADKKIKVCEFSQGECVGEMEFIHSHKCVADVVAVTEVRTAKLNRPHFEMIMGPIKDLLAQTRVEDPVFEYYHLKTSTKAIIANDEDDPDAGFSFGQSGFSFGVVDYDADDASDDEDDADDDVEEINEEELARRRLLAGTGQQSMRRATVSNEVMDFDEGLEDFQPKLTEKSPEVNALLADVLKQNTLFSHLEPHELATIIPATFTASFKSGEVIIQAGVQVEDPCFYVVMKGCAAQTKPGSDSTTEVQALGTFGELDLMYNQPSPVTITASTDVEAYALDRDSYRKMLGGIYKSKREKYGELLRNISILKFLGRKEMLQLADALSPQLCEPGDYLIHYDEEGMWFYMILEGTVEVYGRDDNDKKIKVCEFGPGDCVGEMEFIHSHKCVADVVAKTSVRVAKLNRPHFEMIMGPIKDLLAQTRVEDPVFEYYHKKTANEQIEAQENELGESVFCSASYGGFNFGGDNDEEGSEDDQESQQTSEEEMDMEEDARRRLLVPMGSVRRNTVCNEVMDFDEGLDDFVPTLTEKSKKTSDLLTEVMQKNTLFSHLEPHELAMIIPAMFPANFKSGDYIINAGEAVECPRFYVATKGCVSEAKPTAPGARASFFEPEARITFGELDLMYNQPSLVTLKAATDVETYALDRDSYRKLLGSIYKAKRQTYGEFLRQISLLKFLAKREILQLADALAPQICQAGDTLIAHGSDGEWFYIIIEGEVEVFGRDSEGQTIKVCEFGPGDCVGELEFINDHKCVADVVAKTQLRVAKLNRPHFEMIMGPIKDLVAQARQEDTKFQYYNNLQASLKENSPRGA